MPPRTNNLLARWKLSNLPSPIVLVGLKFIKACLLPLTGFRELLGTFEGLGFSDGGKVGIGGGVEGFISSRVIGVIIGIRFFIFIFIIIFIWRSLKRILGFIFIIRGNSRSGFSVLPKGWR